MTTATVSAAGGMAFSALTILAGVYMLVALVRRGFSKMRVRLLVGVVVSDLAIGLTSLPPQALYIAGRPILTGQKGCNAQAFLYTTALLTQPMMSFLLALATYTLIKHPLHPTTTFIEKYSCFTCIIVWALCSLHSGLWWHFIGFEQSTTMCRYASNHPKGLDRNLVQFVPRTFVFIALIVMYSKLFSFLRRPDQIDLSSHDDKCDIVTRVSRKYQRAKDAITSCSSCTNFRDPEPSPQQAPWEALSFANPELITEHEEKPHPPDSISKASMLSGSTFSKDSNLSHSIRLTRPQLAYVPEPHTPHKPRTPLPSRRTSNESLTMNEFFASEPAPGPVEPAPQVSAAQYFNRQASLLMLWFPLAYMATFLLSIICLAHHMSGGESQVFSVMSLWMILMVGLIDAGVYGVVEVVVRRRCRAILPSHFG